MYGEILGTQVRRTTGITDDIPRLSAVIYRMGTACMTWVGMYGNTAWTSLTRTFIEILQRKTRSLAFPILKC